jgi:hypothetical protein
MARPESNFQQFWLPRENSFFLAVSDRLSKIVIILVNSNLLTQYTIEFRYMIVDYMRTDLIVNPAWMHLVMSKYCYRAVCSLMEFV